MKITSLFLLLSFNAFAQSMSQSFPAGKGASYKVKMDKNEEPIFLSIYVAGTKVDSVNIEYFLETKGLLGVQMWQQFEVGIKTASPAEVRRGYVQTKELKNPEIIPADFLKGAQGGVQVNDFLFQNKNSLDKNKIGIETIEIAAGTTKATHYRTTNNGQTVDFWISDEAKPLGLVLLTSKGKKDSQNYGLELVNLTDNVKAKIVPETAVPLTETGKAFLARPEALR
jgi:hypothetical protein